MKTDLILGLGTGRCGTLWLHDFITSQNIPCTSEACKLGWYYNGNIDLTMEPMKTWAKSNISADVGFPTLPHVNKLSNFFNIKIIILKRNKTDVIKSFMQWIHIKHNYWVDHPHDCPYIDDGWDYIFPKFKSFEYKSKEEAINAYYDHYYQLCDLLEHKYPILHIKTETLDTKETQENILSFIGINKGSISNSEICRKNKSHLPII